MRNKATFEIYKTFDLADQDYKVMSLLYQPLLGMDAHSLYLTLYHLNGRFQGMTHQAFFDLVDLKQAEFLKMRNKLEALNLLEVYQAGDQYIYYLKTPLTAQQFLLDTIFGSYLQSEIGDELLNSITEFFQMEKPDFSQYQNITKPFDSMYEVKQLSLLKLDKTFKGRTHNGGSIINNQFDYHKFIDGLPERLKQAQLLNQNRQKQISKIAYVYQFSVQEMIEVYTEAAKSREIVSFPVLNHRAKLYYESKNQTLEITEKDLPQADIISQLPPQIIIQKYSKTNAQGMALSTATSLLERNHVDPGLINVILIFILKHKEGVLPNLKYMETVLHDWLNKGIRTAEDAIKYTQELETSWKRKPQRQRVAEPDWMDDYVNELKKLEESS